MKKLSLLLISLMMLSLVACGNKTEEKDEQNPLGNPIENPLLNGDDSKEEVEVNEDFEEVVLYTTDEYTVSVVDMKYEDEKHSICIAVDNKTDKEIKFDVCEVAVNDLMCFDFDWDDEEFPAGKKTVAELEIKDSHLKYIGVAEDILKVDMCVWSKVNENRAFDHLIYYPQGEEAANNITTSTKMDGTVIFENEYYKICYKDYLERYDESLGNRSLGDILFLTVENKTDELVRISNGTIYTINDSDTTDHCEYTSYLFPNGTYEQRLYFMSTGFEEGMKLSAEFHLTDLKTDTKICSDILTIVIE